MAKTSALDTLIGLAREAVDQAARLLASERTTQQQVQQQLKMLDEYRLEYARRMQEAMCQGIDPASLANYRQFLASLDQAITRARQTLLTQQQKVENSQRAWQAQHRTLNAYCTLSERRQQAETLRANRREQRDTDEVSSRSRTDAALSNSSILDRRA
ncbi:flagellar export protein FliJ [Pseudomonas sp. NW5]|uniref:flagellar export protein FliJ n=1 Tax=Pseudomonas sp. NW5 TaxID=2934934 RepID=UPI00202175C0|nr:flagellar export protein FliJ [Pseudomonas sp. NW5]MCL7461872.1 flagellar export protein FliJ [Pseudomonas sp. NW5]